MDIEPPEGGVNDSLESPGRRWVPSQLETALRAGFGDAAVRRYRWLVDHAARSGREDTIALARTDLGDAYAYFDQTVDAIRQFRRAIKVCPKRAEPHFSLAEFYRRNGKLQGALKEYRRAIEFSPYNAFYHYRLGDTLSAAGFDREAVVELEVAVEMAPDDPFYHFWLADLYLMVGRLDSAIAEMQQASMFSPKDGYYNLRLAVLYMLAGLVDDAVLALRRAVKLDPSNAMYHCILADIYLHLKDNHAAMRHYQLAGNLDSYDREHVRRIRDITDMA